MHPTQSENASLGTCLAIAVGLLTTVGLLMIYAASAMKGVYQFGDPVLFFRKQLFVALGGVIAIIIIQKVPFSFIERLTVPITAATLLLLSLIFLPHFYVKGGGASRWLNLFGFSFQPAELAKMALVLFLAKNLSRPLCNVEDFRRGVLPNLLVLGTFVGLLMVQPDFGTSVLLCLVTLILIFSAGAPFKFFFFGGAGLILLGAAAILHAPYRMARLMSFLDPWAELQNGGFQIIQSYMAFNNGGLLGVGLGESKQKLFFLPEAHTDFILSVIGEELGLLGVLLVVSLFAYIFYLGIKIALAQTQSYRRFLAFGLTALISIQACMNMGVTMGLLPTKGIPLPFVSSGATSLLVFLGITGLLMKLAKPAPSSARVYTQARMVNSRPFG